ncbi:MAG: thiamine-phosphate kinase [Spirochaetes bacterium]|nr:thiamine-phosphate kinase [Spirochaetota bacterium]
MKLSDIGGEFAFIRRVTGVPNADPAVVKGVGDDCAVLEYTDARYLLVTVDMLVENTHFSLDWHTPYQVGWKLMEANVSDIVAMGGMPRWAFISLALRADTEVEFMDEFYRGLYDSARRHRVALIGGDTTHGRELAFNIALAGDADKRFTRFRAGARPGELICVTGTLGKSEAGLRLLMAGRRDGCLGGYLEPCCRMEWEGAAIARRAGAMIDVSDGLASEVAHICEESGTGARIDREKIPLSRDTIDAAHAVSGDPYEYALYGGEDFELVFTIESDRIKGLRKEFSDFTVVGEILQKEEGLYIASEGQRSDLKRGYDHFKD